MDTSTGDKMIKEAKKSIVWLKVRILFDLQMQLKEMDLHEGVYRNQLFTCQQMKGGQHHLYDFIEVP